MVEFVGSFTSWQAIPDYGLPEMAFAGRSNVGKSSLINALLGVKKLAHVSSTPGKTQTLNVYLWKNVCVFVDLPGVGYAKTSKTYRRMWLKMIKDYFISSPRLKQVFYLVDISIPPQWIDGNMVKWFLDHNMPLMIIFTKKDKISSHKISNTLEYYDDWLSDNFHIILPPHMVVSSTKKDGIDLLKDYITNMIG